MTVVVAPIGKYDYRSVVENNKKEEFYQYTLKTSELCYEIWKYKSTPNNFVHKHVGIADYEGFSFAQLTSAGSKLDD